MTSTGILHNLEGAKALDRGLALLGLVLEAGPTARLADLAPRLGIPISTAQRLATALVRRGMLCRRGGGSYAAGRRLAMISRSFNWNATLAEIARPAVEQLAARVGATAHLGVLEGGMVSYLVRAHGSGMPAPTNELSEFEAYCTAIGKVLLAYQTSKEQDDYLAAGPFVALTNATVTEPKVLRRRFAAIRRQGYATDSAEFHPELHCLAVPVQPNEGEMVAAVSIASVGAGPVNLAHLQPLRDCAKQIAKKLSG